MSLGLITAFSVLLSCIVLAILLHMLLRPTDPAVTDALARLEQQQHDRELLIAQVQARADTLENHLRELDAANRKEMAELRLNLERTLAEHRSRYEQRHGESLRELLQQLQQGSVSVQKQVSESLAAYAESLQKRFDVLAQNTDTRLKEISGQVEKRLAEGFEKTNATFVDVQNRLVLIDEAQKKITELSGNVVSLQEVLADKRSRGAFGEVQLNALVQNVMPETSYAFQYKLPNGKIADCILFLPEPTGNVVIDAKFPLEGYQAMMDNDAADSQRGLANRRFKQDIKKHIRDIASKYILPGTTSDGAMMFIPAEAIFAEIQAHHPDLVAEANQSRVWMCSPTTAMAVLNTARAVLKDAATRKQVHIIQDHLAMLSKDFDRFKTRMDKLSTHIRQAHEDVDQVKISADKISDKFGKIERVELTEEEEARPALTDTSERVSDHA